MLQLRPTFSESWYRVVNLKPKLRGTAQISRQYYRGERWYVVRDAASNQFHRLSDAAYRFVGLLDGTRTVGDAWDLVGGQLADDAPTQPEVIQILSQLYAANLVETDISPDATILLRRHKKQQQRKLQGRLMNVLFPRIPIWDPDRFLCRWMPLARIAFSKIGAIVWIIVVGAALFSIAPHWEALRAAAGNAINMEKPENAVLLWGTFVLIKFIHECGHAFSCRRFGGEVHEMGIMFLIFIPTPYVDASTAWAFPNKWARMFVGAAGMIVELFVAALCAFVWLATKDSQSGLPITQLAYNTMLIASVSTVLFNANPLLRYDGYYMLSDYLEIPNLQMRSKEYVLGLIKRHIFRLKPTQPLPPPMQRVQLFVYGILSTIYRVFIGVAIILMVTWQLPIIGVLMGLGGVVTWLVVPAVKLFKYLAIDPELHRKRGRAWAFSGGVAVLAVFLVGVFTFPMNIYVDGVVEPEKREVLRAFTPGWVREIKAKDGDRLKADDTILICESPELDVRIAQNNADLLAAVLARNEAATTDPAKAALAEEKITLYEALKKDLQLRKDGLVIRAPIDGFLVAPDLHNYAGRFLQKGVEIATVATNDSLLVRATLPQRDASLAFDTDLWADHNAEIRLVGQPDTILYALSASVIDAAQEEIPHARIGAAGGGDVQIDPSDRTGKKLLTKQFELRAIVANPSTTFYPGQGASVRLRLSSKPLLYQGMRRFLQLVRSRSSSKWL